jgi:GWxTD domain-containing protein
MLVFWLTALAALGLGGQGAGQPDAQLVLRAIRSYRAEQGRTEVNAFVQIPYMALDPTSDGSEGLLSYRVSVKVTDSTGLTLLQQSWQNHAPEGLRRPEAFAVEMVKFSLAPGRYRLDVGVEDSVSGRHVGSSADLEGFTAVPPASDLLLSPKIRPATADDTVPRPAELRWGRMLVTAAAQLELTPLRPTAFYLLEAYAAREETGTLSIKVMDGGGKAIMTTAPSKVTVPSGGGVLQGQLDLTGLPPGQYTMTAGLDLGSQTVERSAVFAMAPLEETLEKAVANRKASLETDAGYFDAMDEEQLNTAKAPLILVAGSRDLAGWSKDLSLRAKRRFLADFWQRRDQAPNTPANEIRQQFYEAVAYADKAYGEKGRARVPGWRTDRGRIYVKNGSPEETLQRQAEGRSIPYEVWRYRRGKDRYYIFADRTNGLNIFQLIYTNDVKENSLPNWQEILHKEDAVIDIERFLGFDLPPASSVR